MSLTEQVRQVQELKGNFLVAVTRSQYIFSSTFSEYLLFPLTNEQCSEDRPDIVGQYK